MELDSRVHGKDTQLQTTVKNTTTDGCVPHPLFVDNGIFRHVSVVFYSMRLAFCRG